MVFFVAAVIGAVLGFTKAKEQSKGSGEGGSANLKTANKWIPENGEGGAAGRKLVEKYEKLKEKELDEKRLDELKKREKRLDEFNSLPLDIPLGIAGVAAVVSAPVVFGLGSVLVPITFVVVPGVAGVCAFIKFVTNKIQTYTTNEIKEIEKHSNNSKETIQSNPISSIPIPIQR